MLQWFIKFPELAEFTEFNKSSAPFRKNSNIADLVLAEQSEVYPLMSSPISNLLTNEEGNCQYLGIQNWQ